MLRSQQAVRGEDTCRLQAAHASSTCPNRWRSTRWARGGSAVAHASMPAARASWGTWAASSVASGRRAPKESTEKREPVAVEKPDRQRAVVQRRRDGQERAVADRETVTDANGVHAVERTGHRVAIRSALKAFVTRRDWGAASRTRRMLPV